MSRAPFKCDVRVFGSCPEGHTLLLRFANALNQETREAIAEAFESFISRSRIEQDNAAPWLWSRCGRHHEARIHLTVADHHDNHDAVFHFATDVENLMALLHNVSPILQVSSLDLNQQEGVVDDSFESARSRARTACDAKQAAMKASSKALHKLALVRVHNQTLSADINPPKQETSQILAVHWAARTQSGTLIVQGWTTNCDANALYIFENDHCQARQSETFSRAADHIRFQLHPSGSRAIIADLEQVYEIDIPSARTTTLLVASEAPDYYPVGASEYLLSYGGACYAGDGQILVVTSRDLRLMDLRGDYPVVVAKAKCDGGSNIAASEGGRFAVVECHKGQSRAFCIESNSITEIGKVSHSSSPFAQGPAIYTYFRNSLFRFDNLEQAASAAHRKRESRKHLAHLENTDRQRLS